MCEVDAEDMNREKFWNGSIIKLPQPSPRQLKGAPWFESGEKKIPPATGDRAKQSRVEEVRQEEKTAQPIFMLASSNLGDEILVRGVDLSRPDKFIPK